MAETDEQRAIRRNASSWLTAAINAGGFAQNLGSAIRGEVILTLSNLYSRFTLINLLLLEKYHVRTDRTLVRFYMKGGNAFDCIRNPNGAEATIHGGGGSDWDTQVVIDPWAPLPLQRLIYSLVEDIVLDEFRQAGQRIAIREDLYTHYPGFVRDFVQETLFLWNNPPPVPPPLPQPETAPLIGLYQLTYDEPQTIRKIYDRDQLGLWTDTRQRLGDQNINHPEWMPGQVFNAAIKPFDLYRLGYTWHMTPAVNGCPDIAKPLLMELIDVTIPRPDTIEAVSVWEELAQNHIRLTDELINVNVLLPSNGLAQSIGRDLPLPDIYYHVRELLTMMSEIADGSSHHADKIIKRFRRFNIIWNNYNQAQITTIVDSFVSRAVAALPNPPLGGRVHAAIVRYATPADLPNFGLGPAPAPPPQPGYLLAWKLMREVEDQTAALLALPVYTPDGKPAPETVQAFHQARANLNASFYLNWLSRSFSPNGNLVPLAGSYAYSDDLVLLDTLMENAYLDVSHVRLSGVDQAVVVRVANHDLLQAVTGRFLNRFDTLVPPRPGFTVRHKLLQTTRTHGITHEAVFVIFDTGRPVACFTLTTASAVELPFLTSPVEGEAGIPRCPPGELAHQRRVMAALIDDYVIKTSLSSQYELLKELITP